MKLFGDVKMSWGGESVELRSVTIDRPDDVNDVCDGPGIEPRGAEGLTVSIDVTGDERFRLETQRWRLLAELCEVHRRLRALEEGYDDDEAT